MAIGPDRSSSTTPAADAAPPRRRRWRRGATGLVAGLTAALLVGAGGTVVAGATSPAPVPKGLFVTGYEADSVVRYQVDGTATTVASGVSEGWGVDIGPDGSVYVGEKNHIRVVAPDGSQRFVGSDYWGYSGVAVAADGTIWTAAAPQGALVHLRPDGSEIAVFGGLAWPLGVAVDAQGNAYVAERDAGQITKVDPAGQRTTVATGVGAWAVAVDAAGAVYSDNGDGVARIAADGTRTQLGAGMYAMGLAVDDAGNLFAVDSGGDRIVQIAADGSQRTVTGTFGYPTDVAVRTYADSPTLTGTPPGAARGADYSYAFTMTGAPAPTLSLAGGTLPPGLTLAGSSLVGRPTQNGTFTFTLKAGNGFRSDAVLPVTLVVGTAPSFTGGDAPTGTLGGAYWVNQAATGSPAAAVSVSDGSVPPGLSLSGSGILSGTPTTAGSFGYTLTAANALGVATRTQQVTINPATTGQVANAAAPASVAPGAWENGSTARVFAERFNQTLATDLTVGGTTVPAGTRINSYYLHADPVGDDNVAHPFAGSVSFGTPVLAVASTTADLRASAPLLGRTSTAYSAAADQGLEYNDTVSIVGNTKITVSLNVYNGADAVRVITLAP